MGTKRIPKYIQNFISWLNAPENHQQKNNFKERTDFRPKVIDIQMN